MIESGLNLRSRLPCGKVERFGRLFVLDHGGESTKPADEQRRDRIEYDSDGAAENHVAPICESAQKSDYDPVLISQPCLIVPSNTTN